MKGVWSIENIPALAILNFLRCTLWRLLWAMPGTQSSVISGKIVRLNKNQKNKSQQLHCWILFRCRRVTRILPSLTAFRRHRPKPLTIRRRPRPAISSAKRRGWLVECFRLPVCWWLYLCCRCDLQQFLRRPPRQTVSVELPSFLLPAEQA